MSNLLRNLTSRGLSFAHLAKVPARAGDDTPPPDDKGGKKGNAEGDDQENNDQDRENGDAQGGSAEGDDQENNDKGGKKGEHAADEKDDPDADDDDDEEEMRGSSASAKARRRERMRCATIMGSAAAGKNPVLAANLAFNTSMTRKEALAVLDGTPAPAAAVPVARRNPQLGAGGDRGVDSQQAIQASWDLAMEKARPSRRR